jgi:cell division protease FtsH
MAGGYTLSLPEDERYVTRSKFLDQISMALGGRISEELVFNEITTGASADLEHVSKMARNMVTRFGMSERLGPMIFGKKDELVFLGREIGEQRDYSESVAEEIDIEVRLIVSQAYEKCRSVLMERRDKLNLVAETLLDVETLDREQFERLVSGETAETPPKSTPPQAAPGSEKKPRKSKGSEDSATLDLPPAPAPA